MRKPGRRGEMRLTIWKLQSKMVSMKLQHRNRLLSARKQRRDSQKAYENAIKNTIAAGVSQKEICDVLGISQSVLSRHFGKRRTGKGTP